MRYEHNSQFEFVDLDLAFIKNIHINSLPISYPDKLSLHLLADIQLDIHPKQIVSNWMIHKEWTNTNISSTKDTLSLCGLINQLHDIRPAPTSHLIYVIAKEYIKYIIELNKDTTFNVYLFIKSKYGFKRTPTKYILNKKTSQILYDNFNEELRATIDKMNFIGLFK